MALLKSNACNLFGKVKMKHTKVITEKGRDLAKVKLNENKKMLERVLKISSYVLTITPRSFGLLPWQGIELRTPILRSLK